jgi:hypothetical protein
MTDKLGRSDTKSRQPNSSAKGIDTKPVDNLTGNWKPFNRQYEGWQEIKRRRIETPDLEVFRRVYFRDDDDVSIVNSMDEELCFDAVREPFFRWEVLSVQTVSHGHIATPHYLLFMDYCSIGSFILDHGLDDVIQASHEQYHGEINGEVDGPILDHLDEIYDTNELEHGGKVHVLDKASMVNEFQDTGRIHVSAKDERRLFTILEESGWVPPMHSYPDRAKLKINDWLLVNLMMSDIEMLLYRQESVAGSNWDRPWHDTLWRDIWFTDECALHEERLEPCVSEG